jgi:hypothetical protein
MQNLTYRTDDLTRWGNGNGSDLSALQIDLNFWSIFGAIDTLENEMAANTTVGIDFISITGNQLFVHLTNHSVQGPFTVPSTVWNPRGVWTPVTNYSPLDVVSFNGALYLVNVSHISGSSFSPNSTDGNGHNLYTLMLQNLQDMLPAGGAIGQRLVRQAGSPFSVAWDSDKIRMAMFIAGQPATAQRYLQYGCVDHMHIPIGAAGSVAYSNTDVSGDLPMEIQINQNTSPIGTITFDKSPLVSVSFPAQINLVPGDIISMNTINSTQDPTWADVSVTLVALLDE